jgi:HEAT repeat protein
MAALFSSGDLNAIIRAGQKLLSLLGSADEQDRIRAAVVIGRVADKNFYTSLIQLLNDPSVAVQRQAISASASTRNIKLVPYLFSKLHVDELRRSIITASHAQGEEVID